MGDGAKSNGGFRSAAKKQILRTGQRRSGPRGQRRPSAANEVLRADGRLIFLNFGEMQ